MLEVCPKLWTESSRACRMPQVSPFALTICNYKGLKSTYASMEATPAENPFAAEELHQSSRKERTEG